jgi:hypothetical protein
MIAKQGSKVDARMTRAYSIFAICSFGVVNYFMKINSLYFKLSCNSGLCNQ